MIIILYLKGICEKKNNNKVQLWLFSFLYLQSNLEENWNMQGHWTAQHTLLIGKFSQLYLQILNPLALLVWYLGQNDENILEKKNPGTEL